MAAAALVHNEKKSKGFADVALYWPNLLDYVRLLLVLFGMLADISYQCYYLNAACYVLSVYLDMWDGTLARAMGQCSKFGQFLDYAIDVVAEAIFLCQICQVYRPFTVWFCFITPVNVFGLVLLAYEANNMYWKDACELYAPKVNRLFMKAGGYTKFGYWINFLCQVFYAFLYVWLSDSSPWALAGMTLLAVPWALGVVHLVCLLIIMLRAYSE